MILDKSNLSKFIKIKGSEICCDHQSEGKYYLHHYYYSLICVSQCLVLIS